MRSFIAQNPKILGGKPIIAGTRMSVESVLELAASGMDTSEILKEYPFLKKEQIKAALDYAKKLVAREESYIFEKSHEVSGRR